MSSDSPTPADETVGTPFVADAVSTRPPGRSVLGLPARLALTTLLAIAVCVAGIVAYADHRIQDAARASASEDAVAAARDVAGRLAEADVAVGGDVDAKVLRERLASIAESDGSIESIVVFASGENGSAKLVVETGASRGGMMRDAAQRAVRSADEQVAQSGDGGLVQAVWPLGLGTEKPIGAVGVEYRADDVLAPAAAARRQLILGSTIGAALLGVILLLLLRRELFRPLEEMRRVMSQIRSGVRGVRIGWSRRDELGAVANDFDAMVAELEAAQDELAQYVHTDPLTGLLNKAAFTDRFSGELTRARREGYPISLLAIDVDDLAEINATHGRDAGDRVLAALGEVVGGCTRPTDYCGRSGGDSFLVALVGAEAAQAAVVIQRIRQAVSQRVGIGPERTRVTCGYGVAEYPTHAVDQLALEKMAEAACGHAQRAGRDQAIAFGPAGGYVDALSLVPAAERTSEQPIGERELATTMHALARALDAIDPALGGSAHSQRVARYAVALARDFDLADVEVRALRSAAVLHDIGKVAVPPAILRVPEESLDDRQRGALRYHAWVARTMIAAAGLPQVADTVFRMPERWDGTGYPERASGPAIPLTSRILRAAELLDQLITGHGGRDPMSPFQASGEIKRRGGTELDPDVAVALARLVREEHLVTAVDTPPAGSTARQDAA